MSLLGSDVILDFHRSCCFHYAVIGSWDQPLTSLSIKGSLKADGGSFEENSHMKNYFGSDNVNGGIGGASGGTILLFLRALALGDVGILSSVGGHGSPDGSGGGGGGRIHFHWSDIPTGDVYQPVASVEGSIHARFVYVVLNFTSCSCALLHFL